MNAIVINKYGGPEVLEYAEVPRPVAGHGEILIRTKFAAINPADWKVRQGNLKLITGKKFPKILGIEGSGIIEEIGAGVEGYSIGQHVFAARNYTTGTYAEYFKAPQKNVMILPESMALKDAASIAVTGVTAYQSLVKHSGLEEGMNVLVNGASGGVGIMAVQIAKILGANVTGVCSAGNNDFVQSLGADEIIDYSKQSILQTNLKFDIIIDAANNLDLKQSKKIMNKGGILIKLNLNSGTFRDQIISSVFGGKRVKLVLMRPRLEDFKWVRDQIALGKLKVIIDKIFDLKDCKQAHEYSETLRAKGKILLRV